MAKQELQLDSDLLEKTALAIYIERMRTNRGYSPEAVAKKAFQQAKAFTAIAQSVRDGEAIPDMPVAPPPLFVQVDQWDGEKGEHGELRRDKNNQIVKEVLPVDRKAHCPNLPEGHPINQRWLPNAMRAGRLCTLEGRLLSADEVKSLALTN
jgi:hypothetical protein